MERCATGGEGGACTPGVKTGEAGWAVGLEMHTPTRTTRTQPDLGWHCMLPRKVRTQIASKSSAAGGGEREELDLDAMLPTQTNR